MNKLIILIITVILVGILGLILYLNYQDNSSIDKQISDQPTLEEVPASSQNFPQEMKTEIRPPVESAAFNPPLNRPRDRVSKKPFGIYITSKTSPIQPERFQGYHTGSDFEVFPNEQDREVAVKAICSGKISAKRAASGYGGVLVQNCQLKNEPITILYGHLNLKSITKNSGDNLVQGDVIGELGIGLSSETDGERKHLHLAIHKSSEIDLKGYVPRESNLSDWIDPCLYLCQQ